ncbi:MAG: tail fiber domain-containing protein [Bacteroidia bacterium]
MKNTYTSIQTAFLFVFLLLISMQGMSQAPASIPYQAVARDTAGNFLANHTLSLRFSIHTGTPSGTIVYRETHSATTNTLGLFTANIGQGIPVTGTLAGVNWANGAKFLEVELDTTGGSSFISMGTTQLNSVPYALFSAKSGNLGDGSATGNTPYWNGTTWVTNNSNIYNNGGNVGVGTTTPATKLDVNGDTKVDGVVRTSKTAPIGQHGSSMWIGGNDNGNLFTPGTPELGIRIFNNSIAPGQSTIQAWDYSNNQARDIIMNDAGGKVGIGTSSPAAKVDINGNIKIADGTQGAGKVLTSDANGLATWTTPMTLPLGISTGNTVRWNGTSWVADSLLTNTGVRIGIGTTSPQEKLHIKSGGIVLDDAYQRFFTTGVPKWDIFGDNTGYAISRSGIDFPFYILRSSGNIGIGTTTPSAKLDVAGTVKIADGTQGAGKVLTSDANGLATWTTPTGLPSGAAAGNTPYWNGTAWVTNNSNVYNNGGNVGVGTTTPTTKLDVNGTIRTSKTAPIGQQGSSIWVGGNDNGNLFTPGTAEAGIRIFNNSIAPGQSTIQAWDYFNNQARDIIMNDAGGKVGIGTSSPAAKVDINGNIKIADGTQGSGKVLTSDANGLATWTTPTGLPSGAAAGNTPYWNGTAWVTNNSNVYNNGGNVGIGTATPTTKLEVAGTSNLNGDTKVDGVIRTSKTAPIGQHGSSMWIGGNDNGNLFTPGTAEVGIRIFNNSIAPGQSTIQGWDYLTNQARDIVLNDAGGKLGIGTSSPAAKVDINGNIKIADGTQGAGKVLTSDANGLATWTTPMTLPLGISTGNTVRWNGTSWLSDSLLTNTGIRIGIGTTSPQEKLHIKSGGIALDDSYQRFFVTGVPKWDIFGDNTGYAISRSGIDFPFYILRSSGNVGIGTTTPTAKLEVAGTVKITDGTQGSGKVLTSDANGLATWTTPTGLPSGAAAGNTPYWNGTAWVTNNSNVYNNGGNVGIGTATPTTKLEVAGTSNLNGDTKVDGVIRTSKTAPIGQHGSSMWIGGNDNGNLFTPGTAEAGIRIFNNSIAPGQSTIQGWDYFTSQARDIIMNDAGGKVGIGTASPAYTFDVTTSKTGSFAARIYNSGNTTTSTALVVRGCDANGTSGSLLQTFQSGNGTTYGSISFTSTGISYNTTSDMRLKKNITDSKTGMDVLKKIQIKDYQYIRRGDEVVQGFLAQQLYEVYPQAVTKGTDERDENGNLVNPWMVDYSKLTPLLIKSVQEQQEEIEALKAQNEKLMQQMEAILKAMQKN